MKMFYENLQKNVKKYDGVPSPHSVNDSRPVLSPDFQRFGLKDQRLRVGPEDSRIRSETGHESSQKLAQFTQTMHCGTV